MSSTETLSKNKSSDIYHDIYDFSILPISLGDLLAWGVKSALRASAAGRDKVHIHVICDPQKSGFSPLQSGTYLVDLFVVEAIPAFYSHPYFSGLSLYRSREDFQGAFAKIAKNDVVSHNVYLENESRFKDRSNFDRTCKYFNQRCSYHDDIVEYFKRTGTYPKISHLEDCLVDWRALQSQFPKETFWVPIQFRLRKLDSGMPVLTDDGLRRDAPFLTWYDFIVEAYKLYPQVRFVPVGRIQEKPLELLRLPNVVSLRTLGMNLAHEITAILHSDLYMGSLSGFAAAAHFSDVPYHLFNVLPEACEHFGIALGTEQLVFATPKQRLHYGVETTELLLECLRQALPESQKKSSLPEVLETNRTTSTDRFFINDDQSDTELANVLSSRLMAIALAIERGEYVQAQGDLKKLAESFPRFAPKWPDYNWLSGVLGALLGEAAGSSEAAQSKLDELRAEVSRYCHPTRLIRRSGRYIDNLLTTEGFRRDGWCEKKAKLVFAPSKKGDFLIIQIARLASGDPTWLSVQINRQDAMHFVLLNEPAVLEVPCADTSIPTEVRLEADRSAKVNSRDEKEHSYQIEGGGLISKLAPVPAFFRGDKTDPREKILSGIYSNGVASNLVRIRLENTFPDNAEVMVHLVATLPRALRKGQFFRIQINNEEAHDSFVRGKYFMASIPCHGRPRHISILLQFWSQSESETSPKDNRAVIKSIDIVPASGKTAVIQSGYRSALNYLFKNLKSKLAKKIS